VVVKNLLGKLAYGALFCVLVPAILAIWAHRLDAANTSSWPQPFPAWAGWAALWGGLALMVTAMWALWTRGKGLPMNAYPTTRLVSSSVYALLAHPMYVAFVLMVAGASVVGNSPAGLWLVTPTAALGTIALVFGYEGPKLRERFGAPRTAPWLGVPLAGPARPSIMRRVAAGLSAWGPWAFACLLFSTLPAPQGATELRLACEVSLPRPEWAFWLSSAAYAAVVVGLFATETGDQLRRFVHGAWLITGIGFFLMLMLPGQTEVLPSDYSRVGRRLVQIVQALHAPWLAFPSFDAAWAVFAAYALARSVPRWRALWWAMAFAMSASCLLTGSQAIVGVLGGMALGALGWNHDLVWRAVVQVGERLSNSWSAMKLGPARIISHALWSATAGITATLLVLYLAGPQLLVPCGLVMGTGLLSAGAWGHLLEGGGRLSRPFGYYGFLLGWLLALAAMALAGMPGYDILAAASAAAAPVAQAIGRLRCIVQGCCHGRPAIAGYGFRVTHKMSRVAALANLTGVPVHPTQLYSIVGNVLLTFVLLRLWSTGAAWTLIGGLYLVLSSLARFVEEEYRGEPQTRRWSGLPIYQWLAIGYAVLGVALSMVQGASVASAHWFSFRGLGLAGAVGMSAAVLMSVDFPASARRFSRLTVSGT
jgi:prolipoprotein diacylglyceryltransferase